MQYPLIVSLGRVAAAVLILFAVRLALSGQTPLLPLPLAGAGAPADGLDAGYRQIYNLDVPGAHATFRAWEQLHPVDPLGPVSDAAAYLFGEMGGQQALQMQLFTDRAPAAAAAAAPAADVRQAFERDLDDTQRLARAALLAAPDDPDALFAQVLGLGLRANYLGAVANQYAASVVAMKQGRIAADRLLALHPDFYDAYLSLGVENYVLGTRPGPERWLLRRDGADTNKGQGLRQLDLAGRRGRLLGPYARLLLAMADLRDHQLARARQLLSALARQFPGNGFFRAELAHLP